MKKICKASPNMQEWARGERRYTSGLLWYVCWSEHKLSYDVIFAYYFFHANDCSLAFTPFVKISSFHCLIEQVGGMGQNVPPSFSHEQMLINTCDLSIHRYASLTGGVGLACCNTCHGLNMHNYVSITSLTSVGLALSWFEHTQLCKHYIID